MMDTFDILLCAGTGKFSKVIQKANWINGYRGDEAKISHVAMVMKTKEPYYWLPKDDLAWAHVTADEIKHGNTTKTHTQWVFESTTLNWNGKKGVQINPFDEWLKQYQGKVWVRRVTADAIASPVEWMAKQVGRPYENGLGGLWELATCYMPWMPFGRTPEPHCTELDAECLQEFGLMYKMNPSKLPPAFWWGDRLDAVMKVKVGEPERLK